MGRDAALAGVSGDPGGSGCRRKARRRLWQNAGMAPHGLLIGCRGWDHDGWVPDFYPPELPRDWRFCFYSNQHRSVLVPARQLADADIEQVGGWRDDCDAGFRFVFELTAALLAPRPSQAGTAWQRILAPVRDLTAGFLVTDGTGRETAQTVLDAFPDAGLWWGGPGAVPSLDAPSHRAWGMVWRPHQEEDPGRSDAPVLALTGKLALPRLRDVLNTLGDSVGRTGAAALFFDDCHSGHASARDARLLAELMGIV